MLRACAEAAEASSEASRPLDIPESFVWQSPQPHSWGFFYQPGDSSPGDCWRPTGCACHDRGGMNATAGIESLLKQADHLQPHSWGFFYQPGDLSPGDWG